MNIEDDVKLDFSDVLIEPQRSSLSSRKDVDLTRSFTFNNGKEWTGVPIVAANMDSTGTFETFEVLSQHKILTALHKHYPIEQLVPHFYNNELATEFSMYSLGILEADYDKFKIVRSQVGEGIKFVCIDVANGYTTAFTDFIKRFRDENPDVIIFAGNVVTGEMTKTLLQCGVDVVKAGIGPGCFMAGELVTTERGQKPIEQVQVGEKVLTHTLAWREVTNVFIHNHHKHIREINGIKSTPNHEYYVLHKKFKNVVNDDNINQFAEWLPASELTSDYFLLKTE